MRHSWLLLALLTGSCAAFLPWAIAEEPTRDPAPALPAEDPDFLCQIFRRDLDREDPVDTTDRTSQIGQWIGERRDEGWRLDHLDFEVGQKPTAFAQGWIQACMVR